MKNYLSYTRILPLLLLLALFAVSCDSSADSVEAPPATTSPAPPDVAPPPPSPQETLRELGVIADDLQQLTPAPGDLSCDEAALNAVGDVPVPMLGLGMVDRIQAAAKSGLIIENRVPEDTTSISAFELDLVKGILGPEEQFLVLARPSKRLEPELREGNDYMAGMEAGEAWLVDREMHKLVCVIDYEAQSTLNFTFSSTDPLYSRGELLADLMQNVRDAIQKKFRAKAPGLQFK